VSLPGCAVLGKAQSLEASISGNATVSLTYTECGVVQVQPTTTQSAPNWLSQAPITLSKTAGEWVAVSNTVVENIPNSVLTTTSALSSSGIVTSTHTQLFQEGSAATDISGTETTNLDTGEYSFHWVEVDRDSTRTCGVNPWLATTVNDGSGVLTISLTIAPAVRIYHQFDSRWGMDPYDDFAGTTMAQRGCAVTALSMGLDAAGSPRNLSVDPGELNSLMRLFGYFTSAHTVDWQGAVAFIGNTVSEKALIWNGVSASSPDDLAAASSDSQEPIIVAFPKIKKCSVIGRQPGGHFVIVTGSIQKPDGTYSFNIIDPGCSTHSTLDVYPSFQARGYVGDLADRSALTFIGNSAVELTVSDSTWQRAGFVGPGVPDVVAIPRSYYYRDFITDLDTGTDPTEVTHYLGITGPENGNYVLAVSGMQTGSYDILVNTYWDDGVGLQGKHITGTISPGGLRTYVISYSKTPGSNLEITPVPGDVNGDGQVNCLDMDLVKAVLDKKLGQLGFDARADVNGDGVVDVKDLAIVAQHLPEGSGCR